MRFISKENRHKEFDEFKKNESHNYNWDELKNPLKRSLHNHSLKEQKYLCIYCEQSLKGKDEKNNEGHLEHIRPRSEIQYKELIFEYSNIVVSCDGYNHQGKKDNPEFCAHRKDRKDSKYNEKLFLNPVELQDIEDYFDYDVEGGIFPNQQLNHQAQDFKAKYMIDSLELNYSRLNDMRKTQYTIYRERINNKQITIEEILDETQTKFPAFYSMLKRKFQS